MLLARDSREGPLERANYEIMIIPAWPPFRLDDRHATLGTSPLGRRCCQLFSFSAVTTHDNKLPSKLTANYRCRRSIETIR